MRNRVVISLVASTLLLGAIAIAQAGGDGPRRGRGFGKHGGPGMDRMAEQLNLSDQQKEQLRAMHESQRQQMEALR
ncbi:MAG: periplasmic heavy metal sensor, partial [Candidatus Korobacteraceae bacterium]